MFSVALVCAFAVASQVSHVYASDRQRFYITRVIVADDDISDGSATPVWFRLGNGNNDYTEWFASSELVSAGVGYDLSRYLSDIGMVPETLTMVKLDDDIVKIEQVAVDFNNYTFPTPRLLGVGKSDISSISSCDIVTVDFVSQTHENEYHWNDCPFKQLKPWTPQNTTTASTSSSNGTNWRVPRVPRSSVNASVNGSYGIYGTYRTGNNSSNATARYPVGSVRGSSSNSVNATTPARRSMAPPNRSTLRLFNANTQGIESIERAPATVPTPAPVGSTLGSRVLESEAKIGVVDKSNSLPPPVESTLLSSNGLIQ